MVFVPLRFLVNPYDPEEIERTVMRDLTRKHWLLMTSLVLPVISMGWLVVAAWFYLDIYVSK